MYGTFRISRTEDRSAARGDTIVRLHNSITQKEDFVAVVYGKKAAMARVVHDRELPIDICQLDQTIRARLGVKAMHELQQGEQEFFVEVHPLASGPRSISHTTAGKRAWNKLISWTSFLSNMLPRPIKLKPKKLMLRLRLAPLNDAEKNIALTSPENVKLIGVEDSGVVELSVVVRDENNVFRRHKLSRVLVGRSSYETGSGTIEHLSMREILRLDYDGRKALGLDSKFVADYPVIIQAHIGRLLMSRILGYGITVLVALLGVYSMISQHIAPDWQASLVTLVVAIVITTTVIWVDLKSRVDY